MNCLILISFSTVETVRYLNGQGRSRTRTCSRPALEEIL